MPDFFTHIPAFLLAVIFNWITWVGFVVSLVTESWPRLQAFAKKLVARNLSGVHWWWAIFAVGIFIACYQAWLDEREKNEVCLNGVVDSVLVVTDDNNRAVLFILAEISNACPNPSIARNYTLYVKIHDKDTYQFRDTAFSGSHFDVTPLPGSKGSRLRFDKQEMLYEKTIIPIASGALVRGWLYYKVDLLPEMLNRKKTQYRISFLDVRMALHHTPWLAINATTNRPMYYPGAEVPEVPNP